jgi:subtilisin family serine protease
MRRNSLCPSLALLLLLLALPPAGCSNRDTPVAPHGGGTAAGSPRGPGRSWGSSIPSEAVIELKDDKTLEDFLGKYGLKEIAGLEFEATTYHLIETSDGGTIAYLGDDPMVKTFIFHHRVWMPEGDRGGLPFDDDDSWRSVDQYETQPLLTRIRLPQAVAGTQGDGELIAILDTGIDATHPLFAGAEIEGLKDFTVFPPAEGAPDIGNGVSDDDDDKIDEGVGHGTHVAGIVHTGAPHARLFVYKVLDDEGWGTAFGLALAAVETVSKGCHVINMSLGLTADDPLIHHVVEYARRNGVAVIASAGNKDSSEPQYPAAYDAAFAVTAVNDQDTRAPFANYGSHVDISAPGVDVISAIPAVFGPNRYAIASGTSSATPFVTAATALAHSRYQQLTPIAAAAHVVSNSVPIDGVNPLFAGLIGRGRVDFMSPIENVPSAP